MYDRTNAVLVRNPNLYLGLMGAIVLLPVISFLSFGDLLPAFMCAIMSLALFVAGLEANAEYVAWKRRVERDYRLVRLAVYAGFLCALTAIAAAFPEWNVSSYSGQVFFSAFAGKNLGEHVRFRWIEPEAASVDSWT
jgi:hypothetical protein